MTTNPRKMPDFELEVKAARSIEIQIKKLTIPQARRVLSGALDRVTEADAQQEMFPLPNPRTVGEHPDPSDVPA